MNSSKSFTNNPVEHLLLTGGQRWLMDEMTTAKRPGWNTIEFLIKTKKAMNESAMERAFYFLLNKYENLRVRILRKEGRWVQEVYATEEVSPFVTYDFSCEDRQQQLDRVKQVCIRTRDWLLPESGNLFKIVFFKFSNEEGRIWFCMHHVVSDFMSMLLLSNEFMIVYNSIVSGKELSRKTVRDYRRWLYMVNGYSRDVILPSELKYWLSLPWERAGILPSDYPERFYNEDIVRKAMSGKLMIESYRNKVYMMDQKDTVALTSRYGNDFENILIAAFFLTLAKRFRLNWLDLNVFHSGRNILPQDYDINVNRLIGFLASLRAMLLRKPDCENVLLDVENVVEQIKNIPNGGKGFSLIGDQIDDSQLKTSFTGLRRRPEVLLNYIGMIETDYSNDEYELIQKGTEDIGFNSYPGEIRTTVFECLVGIKQSRLFFEVVYSEEYFKTETMDEVAEMLVSTLKEIIFLENRSENSVTNSVASLPLHAEV